jgi:hypothetical protein
VNDLEIFLRYFVNWRNLTFAWVWQYTLRSTKLLPEIQLRCIKMFWSKNYFSNYTHFFEQGYFFLLTFKDKYLLCVFSFIPLSMFVAMSSGGLRSCVCIPRTELSAKRNVERATTTAIAYEQLLWKVCHCFT